MSYFASLSHEIRYNAEKHGCSGLRRAQLGAAHALAAHFTVRREPAMVVLPTGTGKTAVLMMTPFIAGSKRALVLAPSRLVRGQLASEFATLDTLVFLGVLPEGAKLPAVYENTKRVSSLSQWNSMRKYDVVVCTPQSASPAIEGIPNPPKDLFDIVLVDEAQHSPAPTWDRLMAAFAGARQVLFTATPFRLDRKEIKARQVYSFSVREAWKDGIYAPIQYIPVVPRDGVENDVALACGAQKEFRVDKEAGFDHRVAVRTGSIERAEELRKLYAEQTSLKLNVIHSGYSVGHIKEVLNELRIGVLDGVICVDMLGEGFDLSSLKIAVAHSPHKSLGPTCQSVGRLTRTSGERIGEAKFLAVPNEIEIEAVQLYQEDAVWEEIIPGLIQTRIEHEEKVREDLSTFKPLEPTCDDVEEISLYSFRVSQHVKVFQVCGAIDLSKPVMMPGRMNVIHTWISQEHSCVVMLMHTSVYPKWSDLPRLRGFRYDLIVVYYDAESSLLFIGSSCRSDALYEALVEQYSENQYRPLTIREINRVLRRRKDWQFQNIGMRSRTASKSTESYRIMVGDRVDSAVSSTDGRMYHRGHVSGSACRGTERKTIGYSSASKIWTPYVSQIPDLIEWFRDLAADIRDSSDFQTGSGLDKLSIGMKISEIAPRRIIAATWNEHAYLNSPAVVWINKDGTENESLLIDLEIRVNRKTQNATSIDLAICDGGRRYPVTFSVSGMPFFSSSDTGPVVRYEEQEQTMIQYLNSYLPALYCNDFSLIQGCELSQTPKETFNDLTEMVTIIDWASHNVDIRREVNTDMPGMISVQDYMKRYLSARFPVVICDHGAGEIADLIAVNCEDAVTSVNMYHCKASTKKTPGARVDDINEVCAQVVKSVRFINSPQGLCRQVRHRAKESLECIKGDLDEMESMIMNLGIRTTKYTISLVQPGFSLRRCNEKLSNIILSADNYVRRNGAHDFHVIASE
jgi:superfamily II DNA or RNA helicase